MSSAAHDIALPPSEIDAIVGLDRSSVIKILLKQRRIRNGELMTTSTGNMYETLRTNGPVGEGVQPRRVAAARGPRVQLLADLRERSFVRQARRGHGKLPRPQLRFRVKAWREFERALDPLAPPRPIRSPASESHHGRR